MCHWCYTRRKGSRFFAKKGVVLLIREEQHSLQTCVCQIHKFPTVLTGRSPRSDVLLVLQNKGFQFYFAKKGVVLSVGEEQHSLQTCMCQLHKFPTALTGRSPHSHVLYIEQRVLGVLSHERCSIVSSRGTAFTTDLDVLATQVSNSSHREVSAFTRVIHRTKGSRFTFP